jgi:hypothetical protein
MYRRCTPIGHAARVWVEETCTSDQSVKNRERRVTMSEHGAVL